MPMVSIICNGPEKGNLYPTFIMGSTAAAAGDEVILYFTPACAPALVPGELEKIKAKGYPDMADLVEKFKLLGGRMMLCELVYENRDMKREDFRGDLEVGGATEFMAVTRNAQITYSF
jgi:predicted peroxiredoxin